MLRVLSCRWFRHLKPTVFQIRAISAVNESSIFKAAADGNIAVLNNILPNSSASDVNARDEYGWTALMVAARNGHRSAVDRLLRNNADASLFNKAGQSAYELAVFWQHRDAAELLKSAEQIRKRSKDVKSRGMLSEVLRRHSSLRVDKQWVTELMQAPNSVFVALYKGDPLCASEEDRSLRLSRFTYDSVKSFVDDQTVIYLGSETGLDERDSKAYFCIDVGHLSDEDLSRSFPGSETAHMFRFMSLREEDKRLISQARPLFDWHRYRFCSSCGSRTKMDAAGYKRVCLDDKCVTHERVHNISYPRVDPTVICSVISSDGQRCLLAHKPTHPHNMYSCIAGFIEPGETMEEACVREVEEEVGLEVESLRYLSSQYWPMPSCLMAGYMTQVTENETIKLDKEELEDGQWFGREEVVQMLTHQHPRGLFVPPKQAIAHQLIKAWVIETAFKTPL